MSEHLITPQLTTAERLIRYWIPVGLMLCLMYLFSTDIFSGENTQRIIDWILELLGKNEQGPETGTNFLVRKFAHFFEYAVLAILLFRAFRADSRARWRWAWCVYAFSVVVVWALIDELHQSFTRTRGSSIYDSLLDSAGGLFALAMITIYHFFKRRKTQTNV
ncbi:MAG: VanZ family protein [Acidobacteriota bacterium]